MICQETFSKFINVLNNAANTFAVFQDGFDDIGREYKIARLEYSLIVPVLRTTLRCCISAEWCRSRYDSIL